MTLLDVIPLYRRAATARRDCARVERRLDVLDLRIMRLVDSGRNARPLIEWKNRVLAVALQRRIIFEDARVDACLAMYREPDAAPPEKILEGIRLYALDRKRRMC